MPSPDRAAPERRWLSAVVLGGQGRYAAAAALLGGLLADRTVPAVLAAHAAVTLGAHRRQLGGHAAARRWDALGLRLATACATPDARAVGAVGAVGAAAAGRAPRGPCRTAAPQRPAPQGPAPEGQTAQGPAPQGPTPQGPTPQGQTPQGRTAWRPVPLRPAPRCPAPPGTAPDPGLDGLSAQVDALVGLAADALGTGDHSGAHRFLAAADRLLDAAPLPASPPAAQPARPPAAQPAQPPAGPDPAGPPGPRPWRPAVRADWVRAELALVQGRAADAVAPAAAALAAARAAGARRHAVKSRIVLAVARAAADPAAVPAAVAELAAARDEAAEHRLLPLVWPAALAAADLLRHADPDAESGLRHTAMDTVRVLKDYADPVGRRLMGESVWVPRVAVGSLVAPLVPSSPT